MTDYYKPEHKHGYYYGYYYSTETLDTSDRATNTNYYASPPDYEAGARLMTVVHEEA